MAIWLGGWGRHRVSSFTALDREIEYLFTDYGFSSVTFPTAVQRSDSNFVLQEFRAGLNYQFDATSLDSGPLAALWPDSGPTARAGAVSLGAPGGRLPRQKRRG